VCLDRVTGQTAHHLFRDLPRLLKTEDLLVLNRSRVFPARLIGRRTNGGNAEVLLLRQRDEATSTWEAFLRPARRMPSGTVVDCGSGLRVSVLSGAEHADGRRLVRLDSDDGDPAAALHRIGQTPLPPYIARSPLPADRERYQTVYARETGSVAAPTAGLHFTDALLEQLRAQGVRVEEVVLHVGPGTFRPVKVDDIEDHRVAAEAFDIPERTAAAIERSRKVGARVIAVGTTVVRTLESAVMPDGIVRPGPGETELVIVPGFRFRIVDALITNFHLPRSSLLLLVAAFAGRERVLAAYSQAIQMEYRFYSYGDAMFIA
jgi:S-adenosylmethionine:tRNA ribosyltransferase-isomerase